MTDRIAQRNKLPNFLRTALVEAEVQVNLCRQAENAGEVTEEQASLFYDLVRSWVDSCEGVDTSQAPM